MMAPRPLRRLAAVLVAALALIAVPAAGSIFSGFKNSLIEFALDQISVPNTLEIAAERIEDPEEGFVRLVGVTIEDREGVWMRIGELIVDWNVSRVLRGELELNSLLARDVEVLRIPNREDVDVQVKEGSALDRSLGGIFEWPRSPIDTRVEQMVLENVFIAEGIIAEQSIRFEAEGAARDEGAIQAVELEVIRTDEVAGSIDFDYERNFDDNTLTLLLQAAEEPGGLVADIFGLPNDATSAMVIDAEGPLTDWQLDFQAETVDVFEAGGEAVISTDAPFTVAAEFFVEPGPNMSPQLRQVLAPRATLDVRIAETEPGRIEVEQASIRGADISLDASGALDRTTNEVDFAVDLAVEEGLAAAIEGVELGRFTFDGEVEGTLDDLTATGQLALSRLRTPAVEVDDANLQATVEVVGQRVAADVEGRVGGIRLDRLTREQLGTAEIDGALVYDQQTLTLENFSIDSPLLDLGISGTVDTAAGQADVAYRLASDQLGVIAGAYGVDAAGALDVTGDLTGPLATPRLIGDAAFRELVYQGTDYGRVTVQHDVALGEEPQGTVDAVASGSPYGPAEIATTFALPTDGTLRLTDMTARALGVEAVGRATVDLETRLATGTLDIAAEDLSEAGDELGLAVGGGASGRVVLEVEDGQQMARADLALDGFTGPGVTIGGGSMNLAVADALGDPRIDLDLDASDVTAQGVVIGSVKGTVTSREDAPVADVALTLLEVDGYGASVPSARVEGTVTDPFGAPEVDLALEIEGVEGAQISSGAITGSVETTPGPGRVDLVVTANDLAAFGVGTERATIDATVAGIDTAGAMTIGTDLTLDGLTYQDIRLGSFVGRIETTEALEAVRVDARLIGVEGEDGLSVGTARLSGAIEDPVGQPAVNLDLIVEDLAYQENRIGRLAGRVEMPDDGDVLDLDITATDFSVAGVAGERAVVDGTVRDPLSDTPKMDAEMTVDGLAYQGIQMGRLAGSVDSNEDGSEVAVDLSLSGVEGEGLTVDAAEITGTVTDPFGQPAVDADLTVRDLAYQDVTLQGLTGRVRTTPEKDRITLDVTLDALDSRGVHIDRALIDGVVIDPFDRPKPTAELVVEGLAYEDDPIGTVRGTVETSEDAERIEIDVRLEGTEEGTGAARAAIEAVIRNPYSEPLIDADIDIADLRFGDLLRIERMDGTVETTGEGEAIAVDLDLAGIEGAGVRVDQAAVEGRVTDPFGDPAVEAEIDADGLAYGDEIRVGSIDGAVNSLDGLERIAVDMRASDFSGFGVRFDTASVEGVVLDPLGEPGFEGEIAAEAFAYRDDLTVERIAGKVAAEPGLGAIELDAGFEGLSGYGVSVGAGQVNGVITDVTTEPGFEGEFGVERFGYADELMIERLSGVAATDNVFERVQLDLNIDGLDGYGVSMASGDIAGTVIDPTGVPRFDGQARAREVRYGDYRIERAAAETAVTEGGERVEIDAELSGVSGGGARVQSARLDATVTNATSDPVVEAELAARGAGFQGNEAAELRAQATVTGIAGGAPSVAGSATASGVSAGGARIGSLDLAYDIADVAGTPTGTVSGTLRDIASGGISAARADLDARLTEADGATNLVADLNLANVDTGTGTIEQVTLDATVADALGGNPRLSVRGESTAVDLGFARLQGLGLAAEGPLSALDVAISTAGERVLYDRVTEPLGFEARATLDLTQGLAGQISTIDLVSGEGRIRLSSPLTFRTAGGVTAFEDVVLEIPGGTLAADIVIHPDGLVGDIGLIVTDPRPLARLTPLPEMTGRIELAADFDTRPGRANATAALDATALRFTDVYEDFGSLEVDLDMTWDGSTADVSVEVTGPFAQPVVARLALPLRPTGGLVPAVPENASIDGRLTWAGDIGTVWPLVPLSDHVLDGPVDVDLRVSGPVSGPEFTGRVSMNGGTYQNLDFGTILTNLTIRSDVRPGGAFALDLRATDAADAVITGTVNLGPGGIDARLAADDAILVRRDDLTAALDADITIRGPLDAFAISGRLEVERAEARLIDVTPPSVITLGDVRIKGRHEPPPKPSRSSRITLDVSLVAPNDLYVRGRGLDSEWEAALDIRGTAASPRITGAVQRIRGELTLLGRDFELEEGLVDFAGLDPINPALDIRLTRDSDDITGGIWIHGRARDIEIDFFSSPALPEAEVLPRLLFGRSRQSLSPIEAVQLAAGVATLLDGTGGTVDQIRSALGVDVLRFEGGTADTGPGVTVGRNIADDVFVGVQQPIGGGQPSVEVEIEVFDNVQIESEVGGETGSSVGVQWKKDF